MRHRSPAKVILFCLTTTMMGCVGGVIPIVGLDKSGKVIETLIKEDDFGNHFSTSIRNMQDSAIPALDSNAARRMSSLREAKLGLFLKGEIGIGDSFNLGGSSGFKFVFANR